MSKALTETMKEHFKEMGNQIEKLGSRIEALEEKQTAFEDKQSSQELGSSSTLTSSIITPKRKRINPIVLQVAVYKGNWRN